MHLNHDSSLTCTHSIAEVVTAVASEAHRRGADYVRVTWDSTTSVVDETRMHDPLDGHMVPAIESALRRHDPFQNGDHATFPAWYVVNQLAYTYASAS